MPTLKSNNLQPFGVELFSVSDIAGIRNTLLESSFVVFRNQDLTNSELLSLAEKLSFSPSAEKILEWSFGPIMEMAYDPQAKNYLFSDEKVPYHWDGAFHREPQFLLFYCQESEGTGGETLFAHTELLIKKRPELLSLSDVYIAARTEKKSYYGGEFRCSLLKDHPLKNKKILRFAEKVETQLNPVELTLASPLRTENELNSIYSNLSKEFYSSEFSYSHAWSPGDLVIADNFSLIHGRKKLANNKKRKFKRIQIL